MSDISIFVLLSVTFAFLILGITGFGSALIAVSLLLIQMPLDQAVPLVLWLDVMALLVSILINFKNVDWSIWNKILPSIALGVVCTAIVMHLWSVPAHALLFALGVFVIWFGSSKLGAEFGFLQPAKPNTHQSGFWQIFPFGWLAGVIETFFGTCGPLVATSILRQSSNMNLFKATMAAVMLPAALFALSAYFVNGSLSTSEVNRALWLTPVAIAAVWVGNILGTKVPQQTVRRVVFGLLILSGLSLIAKALG